LNRLAETYDALIASVPDLDEEQRTHLSELVRLEIRERLRPAYQDLMATIDAAMDATADQAGIWAQPRGQDLFSGILTASLGDELSTDRLHETHLETVAERIGQLSAMMTFPEDRLPAPAPKPETLALQLDWYQASLDPVDAMAPTASPADADTLLELAPRSNWQRIAAEPGFNGQTEAIRRFLATLETAPYLAWQTEGPGTRPPHRTLTGYPAIQAAWRHYVWSRQSLDGQASPATTGSIADQRISLIQSVFAAADTGIHLNRWSVDEAADYISVSTGLDPNLAVQMALRIAARPGYHSAVAAAWQRIDSLSERSKAVLGEHYSETDFQRTLIEPGPRPLAFIEQDVEAWYGARLADKNED
jgi:hypothetical protein